MNFPRHNQRVLVKHQVAIALWVALVLLVCYGLRSQDRYFATTGKPIAFLKRTNEGVTYRGEDDLRWRNASRQQGFHDGDRLATGKQGGATIDFGEGRRGELGPDTIVGINSIQSSNGNSFIINLIKGAIKPHVPKDAKNSLVVTSGTSTFMVAPGESKGFTKPVGGKISEFDSKAKFPTRVSRIEPDVVSKVVLPAVFNQPIIIAPIAEPKLEVPPPPPVIAPPVRPVSKPAPKVEGPSASDSLPSIDANSIRSVYYTAASLSGLSMVEISVRVERPAQVPQGWRGGVQLVAGSTKKAVPADSDGIARVMFDAGTLKTAQRTTSGAIPCASVQLKPLAVLGSDAKQKAAVSEDANEIKICSLQDAKSQLPLVVGLNAIEAPSSDRSLFFVPIGGNSYPVQILVTRPDDYMKLIPYLRSASTFRIAKSNGFSSAGIFSVQDGKIVAQFAPAALDPRVADKVMAILAHSLVFRGKKAALYDASSLNGQQLKDWITQNTKAGNSIYIPAGASLIEVSRDFMEQRKEVADFVQKASRSMFLEKVQIVAFSP